MLKAVAIVALSLALEAGFLLQIGVSPSSLRPASQPAPVQLAVAHQAVGR